jgi:hypothetical protein
LVLLANGCRCAALDRAGLDFSVSELAKWRCWPSRGSSWITDSLTLPRPDIDQTRKKPTAAGWLFLLQIKDLHEFGVERAMGIERAKLPLIVATC